MIEHANEMVFDSFSKKVQKQISGEEDSTLNFCRNAGYNSSDKTAFIQWINI